MASTTHRRWSPAYVGIALGTGTDIALESAGITLVGGDLPGIARAYAQRNVGENLAPAFAYILVGVTLAAGPLFPVSGLLLSSMATAAAMSLRSLSVMKRAVAAYALAMLDL